MNKKISYEDYLNKISTDELNQLLKTNYLRLLIRTIFLSLVSIGAILVMPIIVIIPIVVLVITGYWLLKNINKIREEIKRR